MLNAIRCIYQRFAFKNLGISCLALIFNLEQQTCCSAATSNKPFFGERWIRTHGSSVVKAPSSESGDYLEWILAGC